MEKVFKPSNNLILEIYADLIPSHVMSFSINLRVLFVDYSRQLKERKIKIFSFSLSMHTHAQQSTYCSIIFMCDYIFTIHKEMEEERMRQINGNYENPRERRFGEMSFGNLRRVFFLQRERKLLCV
jgi:hypothetical protein